MKRSIYSKGSSLKAAVEEKYGKLSAHQTREHGWRAEDDEMGSTVSSSDEEEDDEGILASETLDLQIQNTLEAIRKKDPSVYDKVTTFYTEPVEEAQSATYKSKREGKPMYLSDYHRRNLLDSANAGTDTPEDEPATYTQQQDDLKNLIVKEMHAAANDDVVSEGRHNEDDIDGFLVRKPSAKDEDVGSKRSHKTPSNLDVEGADKDPETFLSKFMSARAWVPSESSKFQPFESDDEEEERRADLFEEAYNLRFEDPKTSNEKLLSHARDAAAKYSVRKEAINPRKKAREIERARKDAARQHREEEKARLRKLQIAEAEEKIAKIKEAAGLRGKLLDQHDWAEFLEEGWDDQRWEEEMEKRFGDNYYADRDVDQNDEGHGGGKRKFQKPKWVDDIDIGDLVPDFDATETQKPPFALTDEESEAGGAPTQDGEVGAHGDLVSTAHVNGKAKSDKKRERDEVKRAARQERRKIEQLVDRQMEVQETLSNFGKKHAGYFRYRETSPSAYGLTAQDILMASDSQLNQYAGLKKLAAFRDTEKKKKDKKRLGKKARLRQWRKETFGSEEGPQKSFAEVLARQDRKSELNNGNGSHTQEGKRKKRSRKSKVV